jgi:hypothetical protein
LAASTEEIPAEPELLYEAILKRRQLVIAQGSSTAVSHTKRARFTVTRQKTPALTSGDTEALRGHLRCRVPVDNMG